jgi:thioredoxin 1
MIAYITELTDDNYNGFISKGGLTLVDIYAVWCNPCALISKIVDELSYDFKDRVNVGKLNVDNSKIISELSVRNIPTILIYKNGEIVEKIVGMTQKDKLTELLNSHLMNE